MKLIDIFQSDGKLHAWLFDGKNHFRELKFIPRIYVYMQRDRLAYFQGVLRGVGIKCKLEFKKNLKGMK